MIMFTKPGLVTGEWSSNLRTLLGAYHPNSLGPDEDRANVEPFLAALKHEQKDALCEEMNELLEKSSVDKLVMDRAIGEDFLDDESARRCFEAFRDYFCHGADEPDLYGFLS